MQEKDIMKIPKYLRRYFSEDSQFYYYEEYKRYVSTHRNISDQFICLKGFSSSTPLVNSVAFDSNSMGGGFFFKVNGVGIVVDPGIGFTTLMHKNNIFIDDINVVVVTHAHIDHNCDVAALSSLLHDYNRNKASRAKVYSEYLDCPATNVHTIEWYLDDTTLENTKDILNSKYVHRLAEVVGNEISINVPSIGLTAFHTQHIKGSNDSFGLRFKFEIGDKNVVWGYTSDTAYFDELTTFFAGCDVLLLNISDVYLKDIAQAKFKRSHLGFAGCEKLITTVFPKLALVSEFCCTNGDYRFEIVRALRERTQHVDTDILPAEIGCKVSILAKDMECTCCRRSSSVGEIKVIHPMQEYDRIRYVCGECLL